MNNHFSEIDRTSNTTDSYFSEMKGCRDASLMQLLVHGDTGFSYQNASVLAKSATLFSSACCAEGRVYRSRVASLSVLQE